MARVLKAKSLQTRKTVALARRLLGKVLVRRFADGTVTRHRLTEVEAYDGERDLACHASKGCTRRNAVMYQPGGVWYVYLCYGVHEMLNLVTGPANHPAAVLIRGAAGISGPGPPDQTAANRPAAERCTGCPEIRSLAGGRWVCRVPPSHQGRPADWRGLRRPGLVEKTVAVLDRSIVLIHDRRPVR